MSVPVCPCFPQFERCQLNVAKVLWTKFGSHPNSGKFGRPMGGTRLGTVIMSVRTRETSLNSFDNFLCLTKGSNQEDGLPNMTEGVIKRHQEASFDAALKHPNRALRIAP